MVSRRRCSGHRIESHADAETYRRDLAHLRGVAAWRWVSYECGACGGWHVGQARKRRRRRDSFALRCAQIVGVGVLLYGAAFVLHWLFALAFRGW